jgi:hypothetical protein
MTTKTETKHEIVHFDVEGRWFMWFLRHLWVEGNELKAVKTWQASFPQLSTVKDMKKHFIGIVSGRKKFTGWASKGMNIEKDNQKFWDADQSGEGNPSFPLLDSWEDVLLLKKTKLFIAELQLRDFRMNRQHPSTHEGCHYNSLEWVRAVEENKLENNLRKPVNQYLTEIRNIVLQFDFANADLELLPMKEIPLQTGPTFIDKKNKKSLNLCQEAYDEIMGQLLPIKKYFEEKYGKRGIFVFSERDVEEICRLNVDLINRLVEEDEPETAEQKKKREDDEYYEAGKRAYIAKQNPDYKEMRKAGVSDAVIAKKAADDYVKRMSLMSVSDYVPSTSTINPFGIDVDKFVSNMIEDGHRDRLQPDDPKATKRDSGYIDRDGKFYSCCDIDHANFSKEICEGFHLKKGNLEDAQQILDELGWIKVSMKRFHWHDDIKPTDGQKSAMFDFMAGKGMEKAAFNTCFNNDLKTIGEAFKEDN